MPERGCGMDSETKRIPLCGLDDGTLALHNVRENEHETKQSAGQCQLMERLGMVSRRMIEGMARSERRFEPGFSGNGPNFAVR
jgi:hypothetical protein